MIQDCFNLHLLLRASSGSSRESSWLKLCRDSRGHAAKHEGKGNKTAEAASAESSGSIRAKNRGAPLPPRGFIPRQGMNEAQGLWLGGQGHLAGLSPIPCRGSCTAGQGGTETELHLRKDTNPAALEIFKQLHVLLHVG